MTSETSLLFYVGLSCFSSRLASLLFKVEACRHRFCIAEL